MTWSRITSPGAPRLGGARPSQSRCKPCCHTPFIEGGRRPGITTRLRPLLNIAYRSDGGQKTWLDGVKKVKHFFNECRNQFRLIGKTKFSTKLWNTSRYHSCRCAQLSKSLTIRYGGRKLIFRTCSHQDSAWRWCIVLHLGAIQE